MDAGGGRSHDSQGSGSPGALRSTRVRAPDRVGGSRSAETALAEAMPDTVSRPSTTLTELRWLAAPLLSHAPKPTPARELCHHADDRSIILEERDERPGQLQGGGPAGSTAGPGLRLARPASSHLQIVEVVCPHSLPRARLGLGSSAPDVPMLHQVG